MLDTTTGQVLEVTLKHEGDNVREIVAWLEFLEWTDADHLRHSKFVGLRDDKDPRKVVKE